MISPKVLNSAAPQQAGFDIFTGTSWFIEILAAHELIKRACWPAHN